MVGFACWNAKSTLNGKIPKSVNFWSIATLFCIIKFDVLSDYCIVSWHGKGTLWKYFVIRNSIFAFLSVLDPAASRAEQNNIPFHLASTRNTDMGLCLTVTALQWISLACSVHILFARCIICAWLGDSSARLQFLCCVVKINVWPVFAFNRKTSTYSTVCFYVIHCVTAQTVKLLTYWWIYTMDMF